MIGYNRKIKPENCQNRAIVLGAHAHCWLSMFPVP